MHYIVEPGADISCVASTLVDPVRRLDLLRDCYFGPLSSTYSLIEASINWDYCQEPYESHAPRSKEVVFRIEGDSPKEFREHELRLKGFYGLDKPGKDLIQNPAWIRYASKDHEDWLVDFEFRVMPHGRDFMPFMTCYTRSPEFVDYHLNYTSQFPAEIYRSQLARTLNFGQNGQVHIKTTDEGQTLGRSRKGMRDLIALSLFVQYWEQEGYSWHNLDLSP
jgi:hypothetical protein